MRAWYLRNREARLAYQRAWREKNREHARARDRAYRVRRGDNRRYRDRKAYMREWWANLKATDPERHAAYMKRSNKTRAVAGLPPDVHEMRLVLYEFRRAVMHAP